SSLSGSSGVVVADAPLGALSIHNPHATEGVGFSGFAVTTFRDGNAAAPATDFTATVTWGDGSSSAASVIATGGGHFAVLAFYTDPGEGGDTLSAQVLAMGASPLSGSAAVAVADAALGGLSLTNPRATEGAGFSGFTMATFPDANGAAPATDFTATVTW